MMDLMSDEDIEVVPEVSFLCPKCCTMIHMGIANIDGEKQGFIIHDDPVCAYFENTDPSEIVDAVIARGGN